MQPTIYIPSRLLHLMAPPAVRTAGATDSRPQPTGTSGDGEAPLRTPAKGRAGVLVNHKA